jgi:predicted Zn-dependent protease
VLLDAVISPEEGNPDSAVAVLEPLAAQQPANPRLRELLARALLASGRETELVDRFGADAETAETSPYLALLVARAHERLGDRVRAAPLLARAYRGAERGLAVLAVREGLPPPTAEARRAALAGRWDTARADAERLRARFPASADVASLAGDAILGAGDPQAALTAYAAATRVKRPWSQTRRAVFAYGRAGDAPAAVTLLARHVAGEPDGIGPLTALARVEGQRGEWGRAALLLDHAIALGGGHDPALLALRLQAARALDAPEDAQRFARLLAELKPRSLAQR